MAISLINVALTGLNAAQAGLKTTSHNLSNVNTPGYSRQVVLQGTAPAQFTGAGFFGKGTTVETVRRVYSEHLQRETQNLQGQASHYSVYATEIARLGNLLADPDTHLAAAIDGFFSSVQNVASHPADVSARQAMLSAAQSLAHRFQTFGTVLDSTRTSVNSRIEQSVSQINGLARQVAALNGSIVLASGSGHAPNDLLDQRDAVISDLNRLVGASVVVQSDGAANVFLSNGHALVVGGAAQELATIRDPLDASVVSVGARLATGGVSPFRPGEVVGGELGGLLAFRSEALDAAQNSIGRLAMALAANVNSQHRLGQDLNGALGQNLFALAAPQVQASSANTGSAALSASVSDYDQLAASDYRVQYDGANYVVTRLADNSQSTYAALPQTFDGITLSVAGAPAAGDVFLVQPTRAGAGAIAVTLANANQIAAAAPVRASASSANLGDASAADLVVQSLDPNLLAPVTITFTGPNSYDVSGTGTGNPTGVAYVPGGTLSFNGWSVVIRGAPKAGDTFTVTPNTGGIGDNRNALRLADLGTAALVQGASFVGSYAQLVSATGSREREIDIASAAQEQMLSQAKEALASVSGVNLDEEAANLLRYQQSYQAASKVIAVADSLFDEILSIFR